MAVGKVEGKFSNRKATITVKIPVISFEEDGNTIIYAPSLDVSGYGSDELKATESFKISLEDFFDYTIKKNTLAAELKRLGWHIKNNKLKKVTPPSMNELLRDNEYLSDIYDHKKFNQFPTDIELPVIALG